MSESILRFSLRMKRITIRSLESRSKLRADTPGVLEEPAPSVWFDPGRNSYQPADEACRACSSQAEKGPVQSSIRRRLFERFREEGIPFPVVRP